MTEAGDPTTKYFVLMETIAKYAPVPPGPVPPATQKFAYGKVMMAKVGRSKTPGSKTDFISLTFYSKNSLKDTARKPR